MRLNIQKEPSRLRAARENAAWLVLTLPFLAAPYLRPSEMLPDLCLFRKLSGVPCMFSGFTRAFENMACGRFREALTACPAAVPLYAGLWIAFAAALALTFQGRSLKVILSGREQKILLAAAALLLLANWAWRLI